MQKLFVLALFTVFSISDPRAQNVVVSGVVGDKVNKEPLPYANVLLLSAEKDSVPITGVMTDDDGRFSLENIAPGNYRLQISRIGYETKRQTLYVGNLSRFIDLGTVELQADAKMLSEITVTGTRDAVGGRMEKKTYSMENNVGRSGGSILQSMRNLPGVTVRDGKVQLRGSDNIVILIDGKQTALTGFNGQSGLDNIPASSVERIEVINNPSSKYDANGNAGIVNIVYKKENRGGFNGKAGLTVGLGALGEKRGNLPDIRPQYRNTPKINPSLSLNYRRDKVNVFFQGDYLYTRTLNKNEFVERIRDNGDIVRQQTKRNRNTGFLTTKVGADLEMSERDMLTVAGLFGSEKIIDNGDEPFFNGDLSERLRLWRFLEDELKTTVMATAAYQHKFNRAGHTLNAGLNYTFHREDERYFFTDIMPAFTGEDAFDLISDEHVADLNVDYVRPNKYGRVETGLKFRYREIPADMLFIPGYNSSLDTAAGGLATYRETIPALYGNYVFESVGTEIEAGLRVERVDVQYEVNPDHPTYRSDGYSYMQLFPNVRFTWKINDRNRISAFYSRRVDRPNEVDIRIFPKYDDAEIIKVGNPELQPQFTDLFELGYKTSWTGGYFYTALYDRMTTGTITRIASSPLGDAMIYDIFQNAGKSNVAGAELMFSLKVASPFSFNLNANVYYNEIDAFTVHNKYPVPNTFTAEKKDMVSGNVKFNGQFHFSRLWEAQITAVYLAPDIISQGKVGARFSLDAGVKKTIRNGKGELFLNATDLLNTMRVKREIQGDGFRYTAIDYCETQVVRIGYTFKF